MESSEKDVPCAYCDTSVVGAAFVLCSACAVPVHRDCWGEAGKCPTYACGATTVTDPAVALFRSAASKALSPAPAAAPPEPAGPAGLLAAAMSGAERVVRTIADVAVGVAGDLDPARGKAAPVPAPDLAGERAALQAEVRRIHFWSWLRTCLIAGSAVMLPWLLRDVSKNLLWPWLAMVIAVGSWRGPDGRHPKRRLKQLEQRLDQLDDQRVASRSA